MMDFDLTGFDSLDISDQSQPASMPLISDDSVDHDILNGDLFNFPSPACLPIDRHLIGPPDDHSTSTNEDFDMSDLFPPGFDVMAQHFFDHEIRSGELLAYNGEASHQSALDEQMTRMDLNLSHPDLASPCLPASTTPLHAERGEIDHSIRSTDVVRRQYRRTKKAPLSNRTTPDHHASSTVAPINLLQSQDGSHESTLVQMQSQITHSQPPVGLPNEDSSNEIIIICSPQSEFRARTANECMIASHFIRCPETEPKRYPTLGVRSIWKQQSPDNMIEVSLLGVDGQLHAYTIDNKLCKDVLDDQGTIFRINDRQTLYYRVTAEDFQKGFKEILVQHVKSKQDAVITKELIQKRKLNQSVLRFTRCYLENNQYLRDLSSTAYSCVMTESQPDVSVDKMGPSYGPMSGDTVYVVLKGRVPPKDELAIEVIGHETGQRQQVPYTKNGNSVHFTMPNVAHSLQPYLMVTIRIMYKGEELYQSVYRYESSLDRIFQVLKIDDTQSTATSLPTSSAFNVVEYSRATGARPTASSSRRASTAKRLTSVRRVK